MNRGEDKRRGRLIVLLFLLFVRLKPFRSSQTIAGLWDVGEGVTSVLREMDVARVNPYRFGQGQPAVLSAWFRPCRPTAVTQFQGAMRDLTLTYPVDDIPQVLIT